MRKFAHVFIVILFVVPAVSFAQIEAKSFQPTYYKNKQPVDFVFCGESYTFDIPGYKEKMVWLEQNRSSIPSVSAVRIFDGPFSVPMLSYKSVCNKDEGTYYTSIYAIENNTKGQWLGTTVFSIEVGSESTRDAELKTLGQGIFSLKLTQKHPAIRNGFYFNSDGAVLEFLRTYGDEMDTIVLVSTPSLRDAVQDSLCYGCAYPVRNLVAGIGKGEISKLDFKHIQIHRYLTGNGRLNNVALVSFYGDRNTENYLPEFLYVLLHEIGHEWSTFAARTGKEVKTPFGIKENKNPLRILEEWQLAHWGYVSDNNDSLMAYGPARLQESLDGYFKPIWKDRTYVFNDFDLYFMGVLPASNVQPTFSVFANSFSERRDDGSFSGSKKTVAVGDIIELEGKRSPSSGISINNATSNMGITFVIVQGPNGTEQELGGARELVKSSVSELPATWKKATKGLSSLSVFTPSLRKPLEGFAVSLSEEFSDSEIRQNVENLRKIIHDDTDEFSKTPNKKIEDFRSAVSSAAVSGDNVQCHNFSSNIYFGQSGNDVTALQKALIAEGISIPAGVTSFFGNQTKSAVIFFQEKYRGEILTPSGLTSGNGFVGLSTRAKLNQLYGCAGGRQQPNLMPSVLIPITTPVSTPGVQTNTISSISQSLAQVGDTVSIYGNFGSGAYIAVDGGVLTIIPSFRSVTTLKFTVTSAMSAGTHIIQVGERLSNLPLSNTVSLMITSLQTQTLIPLSASTFTFSHNNGTLIAGKDTWTFRMYNAKPGDKLSVKMWKNGVSLGETEVCAVTPFATSCSKSATPTTADIGSWVETVLINGVEKGEILFGVVGLATPEPTLVTCSLDFSKTSINVGDTVTWTANSNPSGLSAYWYGTKNGTVDANGSLFAGTTNFNQNYNYTSNDTGNYTRYMQLRNSSGAIICTTNTVIATVNSPTSQMTTQTQPSTATFTFSHNNGILTAGKDAWTFRFENAKAGDKLSVKMWKNGVSLGETEVCAVTSFATSCSKSATPSANDVGSWREIVLINGVEAGIINFSVVGEKPATIQSCNLRVSSNIINVGNSATWYIDSNPAGYSYGWRGTNNGNDIGSVPGTAVTNGTETYTYSESAIYFRKAVVNLSGGACITEEVKLEVRSTSPASVPTQTPVAPTCSLSFSKKNILVGDTVSWTVNSNPSGLNAYWYGTKNNTNDIGGLFAGVTNFTQSYTYQPGDVGNYTRYLEVRNSTGSTICTTNTLTDIDVSGTQSSAQSSNFASLIYAMTETLSAISKQIDLLK